MRRPPGRGQGLVADVVAVLGTFLVLGVVSGVAWSLLVDPAEYTKVPGGSGAMGELDLAKRFAADGWYAVIAIVGGFLAGVGLTWWRTRDFRVTAALLVPGAALAAATTTYVGRLLGPADSGDALSGVARGETVPAELAVSSLPVYLTWPIAVLAGALMVLWSSPGLPPLPHRGGRSTEGRDPEQPSNPEHTRV
ncbi:MAG TPA: hypothetical protein VFR87_13875 [Nocardioidaceae bacterium]|nr:hypothetical protein [Nocardioidaceae bacterium]